MATVRADVIAGASAEGWAEEARADAAVGAAVPPPAPVPAAVLADLPREVDGLVARQLEAPAAGFILTRADKLFLLRACRLALEGVIARRRVEPGDFADVPPRVAAQSAKVFVTLYVDGRVRACQSSAAGDLLESAVRATVRATGDTRFGGRPTRGELKAARIDVNLLLDPVRVPNADFDGIKRAVELGVHAVALASGDRGAFFKANVPIDKGYDLRRTLQRLARKAGLPATAYREPGTALSAYRAVHFRECRADDRFDGAGLCELYRGRPVVRQGDVDRAALERALRLAVEYLKRHVTRLGRMTYELDPRTGERRYSEAPVAVLRTLATAWVLAEAGRFLHDAAGIDRARRVLGRIVGRHFVADAAAGFGYLEVRGGANVGTAGFALLALGAIGDPEFLAAERAALRRFILGMEDRAGGFLYPVHLPDRAEGFEAKQLYYPGEALTALVREARLGGDPAGLEVAARVFPYYARLFERLEERINMAAWMSKAYAELFEATGETRYADFVLRINDVVVGQQRDTDAPQFDRVGCFGASAKVYSAGVFLESVAEGLRVAEAVGDRARVGRYARSLWLGMRFLLQCQYGRRDLGDPAAVEWRLGGFATSLFDGTVRIDTVQHCGCAILNALRYGGLRYTWPAGDAA